MRPFLLLAASLLACCYGYQDYVIHSEKSHPLPHQSKGIVKTITECAAACRGKFPYFAYGRKGSSSCSNGGCICACGEGKFFGVTSTFNSYEFRVDFKLHGEKVFPMPFQNTGMKKTVYDCADSCRGKSPYFAYGREGSSSCGKEGCMCACGQGNVFGTTPTFNAYKFETGTPATRPPMTAGPPKTVDPSVTYPPVTGCGNPAIQASRVIGGDTAVPHSWPWQVLMLKNDSPMCGGSLISPKFVVTAAHCVSYQRGNPEIFKIRVGDHNKEDATDDHESTHQVKKITVHPQYRRLNNDIAIMELEKPVIMNRWVSPVCLPNKDIPVGSECYITGWGKTTHPGTMTSLLQQARIQVVSNDVCQKQNFKFVRIPISEAMVCAGDGGKTVKSGCHGDSGGPFVCNVNGAWELHGAVSWGSRRCSSRETYTVFSRIAHFRQWIDGIIRSA